MGVVRAVVVLDMVCWFYWLGREAARSALHGLYHGQEYGGVMTVLLIDSKRWIIGQSSRLESTLF